MSRGFNGQDAVGLCPVMEIEDDNMAFGRKRPASSDVYEPNVQYAGLYARQASRSRGGIPLDNNRKYVLRRLTPIECLRLQGYPDWWCDGANGSDSAIYKAAGNSLAIPCATDVIGRIARFVEMESNDHARLRQSL